MGSAYSQDLRQRVLAALDGGMSKMAVHQVFGISRSTLDDWLRLRAQTGGVAPVAYKCGPKPKLNVAEDAQVAQALRAFVQEHPDRTLEEMALAWHQAGGARVSPTTFSTALSRLGQTRKKRASSSSSDVPLNGKPGSGRSSRSRPRSGSTSTRPEPRTP